MPQGLQVFDQNGGVVLDTNTLVGKVLGVISSSNQTGSVTNGKLSQGEPFAAYFQNPSNYASTYVVFEDATPTGIDITFSGNTMYWSVVSAEDDGVDVETIANYTILYGIK